MMRWITFIAYLTLTTLLAGDCSAAWVKRAGRNCARYERATVLTAAAHADSPPVAKPLSLEQRIAALENRIADLKRRQEERDAEEANQSYLHGRAWIGPGGIGARLGVEGFWDD